MARRYYLIPIVEAEVDGRTIRRGKYTQLMTHYAMLPYGEMGTGLLGVDLSEVEHDQLGAQGDVLAFPENLQGVVGGRLGAVQAALESVRMPSDFVDGGMTFGQVLRQVAALCMFAQKLSGLGYGTLEALSTTLGELSAAKRQKIADVFASLGISTEGYTGATTLRAVALDVFPAWAERKFRMNGVEF